MATKCFISGVDQESTTVFCFLLFLLGAVRGPTSLTTMAHRPDVVAVISMVQVQKKKRLLYGHARQREARPHSSSSGAAPCAGPHAPSHVVRGTPALACTQVLFVHANSSGGVHRASQSAFEAPVAATTHWPAVHL